MLETVKILCPYCGEPIEVVADCSVEHQEYIEDCFVCCRPILLNVYIDDNNIPTINARQENE